jgi:monoterpene epsilon-lactone hydrolase
MNEALWRTDHPIAAADARHFSEIVAAARLQAVYEHQTDVADMREAFLAFGRSPLARTAVPTTRINARNLAGQPALHLVPADRSSPDLLLYLHGGAFAIGSCAGEIGVADSFCRALGMETFGLDYRQAPEAPFPSGLDDVVNAIAALRRDNPDRRIFLAGDSAGGALAISACLRLRAAELPQPAGVIAASAPLELQDTSPSWTVNECRDLVSRTRVEYFLRLYLNGADPRDPTASPHRADLSGLAPLLMIVGGHETLLDEMVSFARKAAVAGGDVMIHVFEGLPHNFVKFAHPAADQVYAIAAQWAAGR